jgi:hypothetical protein
VHSVHAVSAIVSAMRADNSRCISTCALTELGTARTVATPAAAITRNIMSPSQLFVTLEFHLRPALRRRPMPDYVMGSPPW